MSPAAGRELAGWIASCLADIPGQRAAVALGGTGRVARRLRGQGRRVLALAASRSHHLFDLASLPDVPAAIDPQFLADWLRSSKDPAITGRFAAWANDAFTPEEAIWLGVWRAHILESGLPPRLAALGAVAVMRTMAYWLAWNRAELGHKPLPPATVLRHYAGKLDQTATIASRDGHEARRIAMDALPPLPACDLFYCYVPPAAGMKAMDWRLAFWERWVLGDPAASLDFDVPGQLGGSLANEEDRAAALERLLERMVDIPTWGLAYSGDGDALAAAVERLRPLTFRHDVSVPYPHRQGSAIIKEGLMVARSAA